MIKRLAWDSKCFGYEVGTALIGTNNLSYYEFIKEAEAYQLVYIFSKNDLTRLPSSIKKVDEKITLRKELRPSLVTLQVQKGQIRNDGPADTIVDICAFDLKKTPANEWKKAFVDLALVSGEYSRFKTDKRLKTQEFERLYHYWVHRAFVEDDKGFAFVKEGKVRGMITLTTSQGGTDRISLLAVHPDSRKQGIARALLNKAFTTGIDRGSREL